MGHACLQPDDRGNGPVTSAAVTFEWVRVRVGAYRNAPSFIEWRIQRELDSWLGTPYGLGQRTKGVAVDCVNFCTAFLDQMIGHQTPTEIQQLRGDRCLTAHGGTAVAMKALLSCYRPNTEIRTGRVEPGDIAVTGPKGGGPGHVLIAGVRPNTWFHATPNGVQMAGSSYSSDMLPFRIFRYSDKKSWC